MKTTALNFTTGLFAATALAGCATVFEGTSQEISIVSNPAGATCIFERQGMEVGRVQNTPGTANIRKSKYDLMIKCDKPGYAQASYLNHSGITATIGANVAADLILTAGLSSIIDSADGADNKYDTVVNISLSPVAVPVALNQSSVPLSATQVSLTTQAPGVCTKEQMEAAKSAKESGFIFRGGC